MEIFDDIPSEESEAGLPKGNPFSLPENYFKELPESLRMRIQKEEPELRNFPKETGFHVPRDYFHTLSSRLARRTRKARIIPLKYVSWMAAAAMLLLALSILLNLYHRSTDNHYALDYEQLSDEEIYAYLEISAPSMDAITEVYTTTSNIKTDGSTAGSDSNALLEQYILDNIDEHLIREEL